MDKVYGSQEAFNDVPQEKEAPVARLTLSGKPVLDHHGVLADFASKAASLFSEVFAVLMSDAILSNFGPVPDKETNRLMLTGTVLGQSGFEFEFELPRKKLDLFPEIDLSADAINKIEKLFRLAAQGNDDDVAEIVADMHGRTVKKMHEFLSFMVQQEAWCGVEFGERAFRFADYEQIKYAAGKLAGDNIHEDKERHEGEFLGVLPVSRTFEFMLTVQEGLIRGKIDPAIEDPDMLNQNWLYNPVITTFTVTRVGQGRPQYILKSLDDIVPAEQSAGTE